MKERVIVNRFLSDIERNNLIENIERFPSVTISERQWLAVESIATGAYAPLTGFMVKRDYESVVTDGKLSTGAEWTVPVVLLLDEEDTDGLEKPEPVVLRDRDGKNLAVLHLSEKFRVDRQELSDWIDGAPERDRLRLMGLLDEGDVALAGEIDVVCIENRTEKVEI